MKNPYVLIVTCIVCSVSIVAALSLMSDDIVHHRNSFLRQFPPHVLEQNDTLDIGFDSYYVAGATGNDFYLGNTTSPLHLLRFNKHLSDSQHVFLNVDGITDQKFWSLRVKVDSPDFYLADGTIPVVFKGSLQNRRSEEKTFDKEYFLDFQVMTRTSIAVRSISNETGQYELGKVESTPPRFKVNLGLLEKQIDGRFCVDGMLHYSKELRQLVYVYYYRNQFIVADSNLGLVYRGKTIDSVSHAKIKLTTLPSGTSHAAPPLFVNKQSRVWKNFLFVNSGLLSKNESVENFDRSSVIDVYDLRTGGYRFSFYIPFFNDRKMHDFYIKGNALLVLVDRYALTYKLESHYFQ